MPFFLILHSPSHPSLSNYIIDCLPTKAGHFLHISKMEELDIIIRSAMKENKQKLILRLFNMYHLVACHLSFNSVYSSLPLLFPFWYVPSHLWLASSSRDRGGSHLWIELLTQESSRKQQFANSGLSGVLESS